MDAIKSVAYVAHPLGSGEDREQNRANAAKWCAWIVQNLGVAVCADWIILSGEMEETPENRSLGLDCDFSQIYICHLFISCGGRHSPGMVQERDVALRAGLPAFDVTPFGYEPPKNELDREAVLNLLGPSFPFVP